MNHQNQYCKRDMPKAVSSRRGSNFLLHNLEENDVVFGTKGNGRNEVFLRVLESHSDQYMRLSKFQKMGLIQQIIRDWNGNFYILNSKSNNLRLAKKRDHELSPTDPSSRKLYTSVRRMMNYVNSKTQRKSPHTLQIEISGVSSVFPGAAIAPITGIATTVPQGKGDRETGKKNSSALFTAQSKAPMAMNSTDYFRDERSTIPLPKSAFASPPCTPKGVNILKPERTPILVSPEPSPRTMFLCPPPISPITFSKPGFLMVKRGLDAPSLPVASFSSLEPLATSLCPSNKGPEATLVARSKKIKKYMHNANKNKIDDLEESAILALTSLGSP